jgi:hypothetical protein
MKSLNDRLNESSDVLNSALTEMGDMFVQSFQAYAENHKPKDTIKNYIDYLNKNLVDAMVKSSGGMMTAADAKKMIPDMNKELIETIKKNGFKLNDSFDSYYEYMQKVDNLKESKVTDWMSANGNVLWFGVKGLMLVISRMFTGLQDVDFEMMGEWDSRNNDVMRDYFDRKRGQRDTRQANRRPSYEDEEAVDDEMDSYVDAEERYGK